YTGIPGSGKTLLSILEVYQHLINGKKVYSNTWINWKGDNLIYYNDIEDIINIRDCVLYIDEVGSIMNAREWQDTPKSVRSFLQLHRHYKVDIIATTQHSSFVEKSARTIIGYWCEVKNLTPTEGLKGRKGIGCKLPFLLIQELPIDIRTIINEIPEPINQNVISKILAIKIWFKKSFFDKKYDKYKIDLNKPLYDTHIELDIPIKEKYFRPFYTCQKCGKVHPYKGNLSQEEAVLLRDLNNLSKSI
ncbi:hypothetical protein EOL94_04440, partial [bacterium]|nr:hypothetical protein [bacterium]